MQMITKDRIQSHMTVFDAIVAMADGNPGALRVMTEILKAGGTIDPDAVDGFIHLLNLDTLRIYGPKIWMLYKDVCGEDLAKTIAVLRAVQLGFVDAATAHNAIENRGRGLDLPTLVSKVLDRLPDFGGPRRTALVTFAATTAQRSAADSFGIVDKTTNPETVMAVPTGSTETIIEPAAEVAP
jgi:hypothetical protein